MSLRPGDRLGPYEVLSLIGAGGMGEVYKARDTRLERTVAIKVLPSHVSADAERRARFTREAKTISALNHPHICALYDVGREAATDFLVMEYLDGQSLADRVNRGPLSIKEAIRYAAEIASALACAHAAGVVHRDLKPANVFLTATGLKLLDFGIAKSPPDAAMIDDATRAQLTVMGTIVGTPLYMAPEQLEGRAVDHRSDIFALGAVMYEMLTGRRAFDGDTQAAITAFVLRGEPIPVRQIRPDVPAWFESLIAMCLAKAPEDRWTSAADLRLLLDRLPAAGEERRPPRDRPATRWVLGFPAALLLVGLGYVLRPQQVMQPVGTPVRSTVLAPEDAQIVVQQPPMLAPDGSKIAFVASDPSGRTLLWVRDLESSASTRLEGTDGAAYPFWSPDGRALAFFAQRALKRVPSTGGLVTVICDAANGRGGSWNADGTIILSPGTDHQLFRVAASGGVPEPLTTLRRERGETGHRWPQFLPDGRRFLYFVRGSDRRVAGTYLGSLDDPNGRLVLDTTSNARFAPPDRLLVVRDRTLMARAFDVSDGRVYGEPTPIAEDVGYDPSTARGLFSASSSMLAYTSAGSAATTQLRWKTRAGRDAGALGEPGVLSTPTIAPDGDAIAFTRFDGEAGETDVWLIRVDRGVAERVTADPGSESFPVWRPDGGEIAFTTTRGLMRKTLATGRTQVIYESPDFKTAQAWAGDGSLLYMTQRPSSSVDILRVRPGAPEPEDVVATRFDERQATLSPDGTRIAFTSNETGRWEIYVAEVDRPDAKRQITNGSGYQPRWRADGNALFFLASDGMLMEVLVRPVVGRPSPLFRTLIDAGNVFNVRNEYDVSKDGQRFLVNEPVIDSRMSGVSIIANWRASTGR